MDKYRFASDLADVLFYSSYNVLVQQKLGEASLWYENAAVFWIMIAGIIALILSVVSAFLPTKWAAWLRWVNGGSISFSAIGVILAIFLLIENRSGTTRGHYENAARWQELHLDAEELVTEFRRIGDAMPVPDYMLSRIGSIKQKREVLDMRELSLPAPSRKIEMECFAIATERAYGIGIKSQEQVEELKKKDFNRWERAQILVDPKERPRS